MTSIRHFPHMISKDDLQKFIREESTFSIEVETEKQITVWDNEDAKNLSFHFLEEYTASDLASRIHISKDIPQQFQVDRKALADYLWNVFDRNGFITLEELVILWSEPEEPDTYEPSDFIDFERQRLYEEYSDEYAFEIGDGYLGQEWFERNIAFINMGEIVRCCREVAEENKDLSDPWFSFENQVVTALLTTAIHELRHIQMDTNILLPEEVYPTYLASEEAVEDYCRDVFENNPVPAKVLPWLFEPPKFALASRIEEAEKRRIPHTIIQSLQPER